MACFEQQLSKRSTVPSSRKQWTLEKMRKSEIIFCCLNTKVLDYKIQSERQCDIWDETSLVITNFGSSLSPWAFLGERLGDSVLQLSTCNEWSEGDSTIIMYCQQYAQQCCQSRLWKDQEHIKQVRLINSIMRFTALHYWLPHVAISGQVATTPISHNIESKTRSLSMITKSTLLFADVILEKMYHHAVMTAKTRWITRRFIYTQTALPGW